MSDEHTEETITIELPIWMFKQLRGAARYDIKHAKSPGGRKDSEKIFELLDFYWRNYQEHDGGDAGDE